MVAIVAAVIALVTALVNAIMYLNSSKKSAVLKVIVETRIGYLQSLRNANATFIGIANPDVVLHCAKIASTEYIYPKDLADAVGSLKTLLKPFYPIERELIEKIDSIESGCLDLFMKGEARGSTESLRNELATYTKMFAQYDWAYWQYIIKQADGKFKNSNVDFDEVYKETGRCIAETYDYDWK